MFEGKCSAERNVDGIAHNGHGKSVAYYLQEQRGIWSTRGLEPGTGGKDDVVSGFYHCCTAHRVLTYRHVYKHRRAL